MLLRIGRNLAEGDGEGSFGRLVLLPKAIEFHRQVGQCHYGITTMASRHCAGMTVTAKTATRAIAETA